MGTSTFYLTGSSASVFNQSGKRLRMPSVRNVAAWHQPAQQPSTEKDCHGLAAKQFINNWRKTTTAGNLFLHVSQQVYQMAGCILDISL